MFEISRCSLVDLGKSHSFLAIYQKCKQLVKFSKSFSKNSQYTKRRWTYCFRSCFVISTTYHSENSYVLFIELLNFKCKRDNTLLKNHFTSRFKMLQLGRNRRRVLTGFFREHYHVGKRIARIGLEENSNYRFCWMEDESPKYLTSNCTTVAEAMPTTSTRMS